MTREWSLHSTSLFPVGTCPLSKETLSDACWRQDTIRAVLSSSSAHSYFLTHRGLRVTRFLNCLYSSRLFLPVLTQPQPIHGSTDHQNHTAKPYNEQDLRQAGYEAVFLQKKRKFKCSYLCLFITHIYRTKNIVEKALISTSSHQKHSSRVKFRSTGLRSQENPGGTATFIPAQAGQQSSALLLLCS